MAVTRVAETSRSGGVDREWKRSYRRTFVVEVDSPYDGAVTVIGSLPVQLGNYYLVVDGLGAAVEHDFGSFVCDVQARQVSRDGLKWEAEVSYQPYNPLFFPKNPLDHPPKISWGGSKFEKAIDQDINGDAILNSAGDYFDPPVTVDDSRITLRIQRNEARYDPAIAAQFKDAINSDTFYGQQPGTWKSALPTADLQFNVDSGTADGFYYEVTYEFEFRPEGWKREILDQGLKVITGGVQVPASEGGKDVTSPILLDGTGVALAVDADPVFLSFDVYNEIAFSQLNLDPAGAPGQ